jgi:hypothetical protein
LKSWNIDARNSGLKRFGTQSSLSRSHDERAFCGVTLYGPLAVVLLEHRVIRPVGDSERSIQSVTTSLTWLVTDLTALAGRAAHFRTKSPLSE